MNYGKRSTSKKQKELNGVSGKMWKKLSVYVFKGIFACFLAVLVIGCCAGVGVFKGILDSSPDISNINVSPESYKSFMYDANGNQISSLVASSANRVYVKIDDIPEDLQHAFVAVEDERFYEHNGIDPKGILRAAFKGIASGFHFTEGASTITQQLLKNNVFTSWTEEKGLVDKLQRKIQEQYLALELEKVMDKQQILENYLNTINLGQNTLGVQAASYRYFGKPVSELNLSESAVIAGITKNPTGYNPITHPDANAERREVVLDDMLEQGYIDQTQYDEAMADDVYSRIKQVNEEIEDTETYNSYFVDSTISQVMDDLQEKLGYSYNQAYNLMYSGGLSIYTTQDPSIQTIMDEECSDPDNFPDGTEVSLSYALTLEHSDGTTENYSTEMLVSHFKQQGESGCRSGEDFSSLFASKEKCEEYIAKYKEDIMTDGDEILGEKIEITPQPQISMVLMDQSTGYVKAIVGGRGDKTANLTLNRATDSMRSPGSTFKLVSTYAPAIDAYGFTVASAIDDAPYSYESGQPVSNYTSDRYHGLLSIREAIIHSYNIPAVKVLTAITPRAGFDYAKNKFHIDTLVENETRYVYENGQKVSKTFSDVTQSMALGGLTDGATNLEMTAAYCVFANQGMYNTPVFYTQVKDHDGNVILDNTQNEATRSIKESTAWLLTDVMKEVLTRGTSIKANFDGMTLAGKSGTSNDYRDVWFIGYSPYYTCGIWAGYDTNQSLPENAQSFHKVLWKKVMERVHEGLEDKDFVKPDNIVTATVCKKSGKLAVAGLCTNDPRGSMVTEEVFEEGTEPTDYCDVHVAVTICADSGMLAGPYCPESSRVIVSYIKRPEPAEGTTDDSPYTSIYESADTICTLHNGEEEHHHSDDDGGGEDTGGEDTGGEDTGGGGDAGGDGGGGEG